MPDPDLPTVDDIEDALFGVPLAEFVATRNERVRALRKAGRKDDAARLAALRRPAVAAWALNQVARRDAPLVREALELGATMRDAMEGAFGGDAAALRALQPNERSMVAELARKAAAALGEGGTAPNATVLQHLTDTARAALADPMLGEQLRAGRLTDEHAPAGFGFGLGSGFASDPATDDGATRAAVPARARRAPRADTPRPASDDPAERASRQDDDERERRRADHERAAEARAAEARAAEARAAKERAALRKVAAELRREAERRAAVAEGLEAEAVAAREAADVARAAAERAAGAAHDAEQAAERAGAGLPEAG